MSRLSIDLTDQQHQSLGEVFLLGRAMGRGGFSPGVRQSDPSRSLSERFSIPPSGPSGILAAIDQKRRSDALSRMSAHADSDHSTAGRGITDL